MNELKRNRILNIICTNPTLESHNSPNYIKEKLQSDKRLSKRIRKFEDYKFHCKAEKKINPFKRFNRL